MKRLNDLLSGKENIKVDTLNARALATEDFGVARNYIKLGEDNTGLTNIELYFSNLSLYNMYDDNFETILTSFDGSLNIQAVEGTNFSTNVRFYTGLALPNYSTALRPTSQDEGSIIYDSTLKKCILYNGTAWVNLDGTALA